MRECSDYEIELSALLDGETTPALALELVEHVADCSSCSEFVGKLRETQSVVERLTPDTATVPGSAPVTPIDERRRGPVRLAPQFAIGLAASLVLAAAVWFGAGSDAIVGTPDEERDGELVIRLEEDKGQMSEERFVALVAELLKADRRYQREMYVVLDGLARNQPDDESSPLFRTDESEEQTDSDWGESEPYLNAAKE